MMPKKKNTLLRVIDCYFETTDSRRLTSYTMLVIINTTDWGPPRAKPIHTLLQQRFTMTLFEWGQGSEAACPRSQISQGQQQHTNLVLTPKPLCKTTSHTAVPCPLEDLTSSPKYSLASGEAEDQTGKGWCWFTSLCRQVPVIRTEGYMFIVSSKKKWLEDLRWVDTERHD